MDVDELLDAEMLFAGITAPELDAAVELGFLSWAHVTRFAVMCLVEGRDTPALCELAAEPIDERRVEEWRIAPRWHRALDELDVIRAVPEERAVVIHAGHVLRLWDEKRLDLMDTVAVVSRLRDPLAPSSPITPLAWILDSLFDEISLATEFGYPEDIPGLRRAAVLVLFSVRSTVVSSP